MSSEATGNERHGVETTAVEAAELPITLRLVLTAMASGVVGLVSMAVWLVGIPVLFDLFRTEPVVEFSNLIAFGGFEPSLPLGVALFAAGGVVVLPLQFLVVGAFLPPNQPRYLRGVCFATIYWSGFLLAFWPGGDALTGALFLVVSLVSHLIYGTALGYGLHRLAEIPQHDV